MLWMPRDTIGRNYENNFFGGLMHQIIQISLLNEQLSPLHEQNSSSRANLDSSNVHWTHSKYRTINSGIEKPVFR